MKGRMNFESKNKLIAVEEGEEGKQGVEEERKRKEQSNEEIMEKEEEVRVQGQNGALEELEEKEIKMDFGRRVRKRTE